jgi:hypothetical protein
MTTKLLVIARPVMLRQPGGTIMAARLRGIHRHWLEETRDWLAPAIAPDADFWNGWSAVRYLGDQFARFYRRQLAFVKAILPMFAPSDAFALATATARVARARHTLDQFGRRQGMVKAVAAAYERFLESLEAWFRELQRLTQRPTRSKSPAAQQAMVQLEAGIAYRSTPEELAVGR